MGTDLHAVVATLYSAVSGTGSLDEAHRYVDTSPAMVHIGTDAGEWISGSQLLERLREQRNAGVRLVPTDLQVEQEDNAGWAVDRPVLALPDGSAAECRLTLVFVRRSGDWKLVHSHLSMPQPSAEFSASSADGTDGQETTAI